MCDINAKELFWVNVVSCICYHITIYFLHYISILDIFKSVWSTLLLEVKKKRHFVLLFSYSWEIQSCKVRVKE